MSGDIYSAFYYIFREKIPLCMFIFYLLFRNPETREKLQTVFKIDLSCLRYILLFGLLLAFAKGLHGLLIGVPFIEYMKLRWSYSAWLEWLGFCIAAFAYANWRTGDAFFAANYMTQAAAAGGWLYELPIFPHNSCPGFGLNLNWNHTFLVNFQIVSFLIVVCSLIDRGIRINRKIALSILLYSIYALLLLRFPSVSFIYNHWLTRMPTIIMLIMLITGLNLDRRTV